MCLAFNDADIWYLLRQLFVNCYGAKSFLGCGPTVHGGANGSHITRPNEKNWPLTCGYPIILVCSC